MEVLFVLIPLALVFAAGSLIVFTWAVRDGQFDDLETPAVRILFDEPSSAMDVSNSEER
ncbi:cbb3-type cytochrome oxidase assembly protein CcoS [Myxococcota bacterium]|nr:cbb3-type cytochrome oxidase assembly protein CcoS [Myxococcota bacterium]MBU1429283.1 cbb3-type cytochrome oxidase assembly protein CcoS [Myxococcota bacterium]MBU1898938.1 cbb3-type cytochrome oxidase assembly protein CcoS [Myxococcota bacterium]